MSLSKSRMQYIENNHYYNNDCFCSALTLRKLFSRNYLYIQKKVLSMQWIVVRMDKAFFVFPALGMVCQLEQERSPDQACCRSFLNGMMAA